MEIKLGTIESKKKKTSNALYLLIFLFVIVSGSVYSRKSKHGEEPPPQVTKGKIVEVRVGDKEFEKDVVSKQGKVTHVDYRPLFPYDLLLGRFKPDAPVAKITPECLKKSGKTPTPSVLMSIGRSGSTVMLDMLSTLTNSQSDVIWREFVGQNIWDQQYFFNLTIDYKEKFESESQHINNIGMILKQSEAKPNEVPARGHSKHGEWMMNYLCRLMSERPGELVGFQFKPLLFTFVKYEESRETLQLIASLAATAAEVEEEPPIVVIRNRRNSVDVFLSTMKHLGNEDLSDHCATGDEECLKNFKGEGRQFVDDVDFFYNKILNIWGQENMIDRLLDDNKVPYVPVSYDIMFYPDQISDGEDEWNKILQYINPGSPRVSWANVQDAMKLASTSSSRNHADIIANWEEVYARFEGTEIEYLLRIDNQ